MTIPRLTSYPLPTAKDIPANRTNWAFEPDKAALLIHDMQDYFLDFWGEESSLKTELIRNIQKLRDFCKSREIPVFYTAQPPSQPPEERGLLNEMWGAGVTARKDRHNIIQELTPDKDDQILTKWRYSAFFRSPLERLLKDSQRDQLIICGVYAHIGCQTTATDAFMRDIKPFFVADALADFSQQQHLSALDAVANHSGTVVTLEELL